MSGVRHDVDLTALARRSPEVEPPRRGWMRIVLPAVILLAFGAIFYETIAEVVRKRPEVTLVRPSKLEPAEGDAAPARANRVAVQAAGWIEPDPFPIYASALAGGVLEEVLVQESDPVDAGAAVARLVADDARIARDRASAEAERAEAALGVATIREQIARERFDAALEVTEAAAKAGARRVGREAEAELREAAVAEGVAAVSLAESEVVVQRELDAAGAAGTRQVEIAEAELVTAEATLAGLRADVALVRAELEDARAAEVRALADVRLRFTDRLERDVSAAERARAEAELALARAALEEADLRLTRMTIVAPVGAVVFERLAAPGQALEAGAPVCSLYVPDALRVRVDVPQGDLRSLYVGQRAEVLAESRAGRPYAGEVIRIVQKADIQKVTLEAQVRVLEPDALLKPDMLMQVRFLGAAPDGAEAAAGSGSEVLLGIPARLVEGGAVWVLDPVAGVARRREVELGRERDGLVEVLEGLNLTDKVIDEGRRGLEEGAPVRVREEQQ